MIEKRIPGLRLGILFLLLPLTASSSLLSAELFAEGQWEACRREALRESGLYPENPWPSFYLGAAGLRSGTHYASSKATLIAATEHADSDRRLTGSAYYELGLDAWTRGDEAAAWEALSKAFSYHETEGLYKNAGCILYLMYRKHPEMAQGPYRAVINQVLTLRPLWTRQRIDENLRYREARETKDARSKISGKPSTWVVAFYRAQISPAIGARCSLHPSCSAYFLQASREHGLLGIPLIGDRLVREPGVVSRAEHPVWINGQERIADPLSDHLHK